MEDRPIAIELVGPNLFEGQGREECLSDLYRSVESLLTRHGRRLTAQELASRLPVVDWTLCEEVPGYVTLRVFAERTVEGDFPSFVFEMVSRGLLGGRHVSIFTSQYVTFTLPEIGGRELLYMALAIHVDRQAELAEVAVRLPSLAADIELGALSPDAASTQQLALLPEPSGILSQVRRDSLRWLHRWSGMRLSELFSLFPPFACRADHRFREVRSPSHLVSLFKRFALLQRGAMRQWTLNPKGRPICLSLFPARLDYPFGSKEVVAVAVALSADPTWETLTEQPIQTALNSLLPGARLVEGSFFSYQPPREVIRSLYFEIEREGAPLTAAERAHLRHRLHEALVASIGKLSDTLFMPRNEEEVLRSILALSSEMRALSTPPQVIISLQQVAQTRLTFTVILLRLLKGEAPPTPRILEGLPGEWRVNLLQDRVVGKLRGSIAKVASVFTVSLPNAPFLRRDQAIDQGAARQALVAELARLLPGLTDYHGGLMVKQEKMLREVERLVQERLPQYKPLLEGLFYALTPAIMQSYLQPQLIALAFEQAVALSQTVPEGYRMITTQGEGATLVAIRARSPSFKGPLHTALEQLRFDPLQLAQTDLTYGGSSYYVCLFLSEDELGARNLTKALEGAMQRWRGREESRQVLRLNIPKSEWSLDPRIGVDQRSGIVLKMLYEGLMRLEPSGVAYGIADRLSVSEDGKTYTFHLRPSSWSNGEPLTASDFEYAWKQMLDPDFSTPYMHLLSPIKNAQAIKEGKLPVEHAGITAPTPDTLVVELAHPLPALPELLTHWIFSPLKKNIDSDSPDWALLRGERYLCNGPFRLASFERDRSLVFQKNGRYWAERGVRLEEIEVLSIPESDMALALFQRGELDWIGDPMMELPARALKEALGEGAVRRHPVSALYWCELNLEVFPFNSVKMRRAFACALDREAILRRAGEDRPAFRPFLGGPEQIESPLPYGDVSVARRLFIEACRESKIGPNNFPPLLFCFPERSGQEELTLAIAAEWRQTFGLPIETRGYPRGEFIDRVRRADFHLIADTMVSRYHDPLYNLSVFRSRHHPLNTSRWENARYQALIDQAEGAHNSGVRNRALLAAERLLLHEAVVIPIAYRSWEYACREGITGAFLSDIGQIDLSRVEIGGRKKG
ncbi:MAG: peptide ABC transporter substrate-binding protein [Parachlamydiales bacterium]